MNPRKATVLVTGISGYLGGRLLKQLDEFEVVGVDVAPPATGACARFEPIDLSREVACRQIVDLVRETSARAIVHLAFVGSPGEVDSTDFARAWQTNVAGTARVMEAITEGHRAGRTVQKFVFPSSAWAYGTDLEHAVTEENRLLAQTFQYAVHKREADEVVQLRAESLGYCHTYILRPQNLAGAAVQNYLFSALHGTPGGGGWLAKSWRRDGKRLPFLLPFGDEYPRRKIQLLHVDDLARLIAYILRQPEASPGLTILNVAGRGAPVDLRRCLEIAEQKMLRLPGKWACRTALGWFCRLGVSAVPT